ncbi:PucR family transcriptional regulator [Nocardioides sp. NPDC057767]|uniref:PucR family transcriptional regulator n=1 Tax=unclassified Nocardioides TaxID=2615069 RepID=UPI00366C04E1
MPRVLFRSRTNLRTRLAAHLPGMVDATLERLASDVPIYQQLSRDQLENDVAEVVRLNLELFMRLLREGRAPERGDLEAMLRSARVRAEEQIPLPAVLSAYYNGFRACWEETNGLVAADDVEELIDIGSLVLRYLELVTTAVTEVYVETVTAMTGRDRAVKDQLLAKIVAGEETPALWHGAGLVPWTHRTLVQLRVRAPRHPHDVTVTVEARRRVRALRESLAEVSGHEVLDSLTLTGGLIVLCGTIPAVDIRKALARVLQGRWHAGLAHAEGAAATADAALAAENCAEVAHRLRLPTGIHQIADLALEVQVTRPGPARDVLANVLRPLDDQPDLLDTLRAYVAASGRRAETAEALHVHPNTLDYRLRRVHKLTGVDPTHPQGSQLVRAGLVVRRYLR